jgi:RimJ/RimL family protein N-acetyltransferase
VGVFEIPEIETPRLRLRAFRTTDLDAFAAMNADAEVMRYLGSGETQDRLATWRAMAGFNGHWSLLGCGMWAIERKTDGAFVGRAGLHHPPYWPDLELGWALARAAWGQGYAREAAAAALAFAQRARRGVRLVSYIRPGNERSVRVALALGARPDGQSDLLGTPVDVYTHDNTAG